MIPAILAALGEAGGAAGAAASAGGFAGAAEGIGGLTAKVQQLGGATAQLSAPMSKFVGALTYLPNQLLQAEAAVTQVANTLVHALAAPIETVKRLGDSISGFVRLANPAAVTMFEYKVENAFASIGKILEPILQSLGHAADVANEGMNKLAPAFEPIVDAAKLYIDTLADEFIPAMKELAPLIKLSGEATHVMVSGLLQAHKAIVSVVGGLADLVGLRGALGGGGFDDKAGKSVAVRGVNLSSAEGIQRQLAEQSIKASIAGGNAPKVTTEGILQEILKVLKELTTVEGWERIGIKIAAVIDKHLPKLPSLPGLGGSGNVDAAARIMHLRGEE